ncbi:transposase [Streptomyces sp. QH1-20]|uniref:transposase n=1 Tax=Streptomyces sp. QH1-20 TaxID=3240934 RepID=UPI003513EEF1
MTELHTSEASSQAAGQVPAKPVNALVEQLMDSADATGAPLAVEGGLLQQLTKWVLESALEGEITDHVGYDKHDAAGRNSGNSRNTPTA